MIIHKKKKKTLTSLDPLPHGHITGLYIEEKK